MRSCRAHSLFLSGVYHKIWTNILPYPQNVINYTILVSYFHRWASVTSWIHKIKKDNQVTNSQGVRVYIFISLKPKGDIIQLSFMFIFTIMKWNHTVRNRFIWTLTQVTFHWNHYLKHMSISNTKNYHVPRHVLKMYDFYPKMAVAEIWKGPFQQKVSVTPIHREYSLPISNYGLHTNLHRQKDGLRDS